MRRTTLELLIVIGFLNALPAFAERGYPQIEMVYPGAVSRGKTTEVLVAGHYNFRDPVGVVFEGEGVTGTIAGWKEMPVPKNARVNRFPREGVTLKITVAEDAIPGIRPFRIVTKSSLSTEGRLLISDAPSVNESEPNNAAAQAQTIEIPQTVNGLIDEDADADVYKFHARAGDRLTFVVHAARLQAAVPFLERAFSDITISLRDENGRELAAADDWMGEDPRLFHAFEKDGTYYLHLWEARYMQGKDRWWYALSVLSGPQVTSVFPPVVRAGSKAKLQLHGFHLEGLDPYEIDVPAGARGKLEFQVKSPSGASNLVTLGISDLPQLVEPARATPASIAMPVGISGRIDADGKIDRYRFHAKQGERLEFEVRAREFGSALDALLEIHDSTGRLIEANDDQANTVGYDGRFAANLAIPPNKDSRLEWTAPADGDYEVRIRDANLFGSADHVYHLSAKPQQPDFTLIVDDDRLPMGPGESATAVVTVDRRNGFTGAVKLFARGLPNGVTVMESFIPPHLDQGNIVLTASPNAKPDARAISIGGVSGGLERIARPHAPMGSVNGKTLLPVNSVVAAVTDGADIIVEATPKTITLRPGESVTIDVNVTRNQYTGPLDLNVISWILTQEFSKLPKGIVFDEKQSKTALGKDETQGRVTLRAQPDAPPLENYLMTVIGQIAYNRVFVTRSAAPFRLTIKPQDLSAGLKP